MIQTNAVYAFEQFELDEAGRELRLDGQEVSLQPLVLDLLIFLIRNRERVVSKDELVEAIWPDSAVGDGSLQRIVSLARGALRSGGLYDAIRTHARYGYRFVAPVAEVQPGVAATAPNPGALHYFAAHGYEAEASDEVIQMAPYELEHWAFAAYWAGRGRDVIEPLKRVTNVHISSGNRALAARAAIILSYIFWELADEAPARGWQKWAASLVEGEDVRENGLVHFMACRMMLKDGKLEKALRQSEETLAIGRKSGDLDIEALALAYKGMTLITIGQAEEGTALLDEAGAMGLGGPVSPWVGGIIYCGILWACRGGCDWQRAAQWSENYIRWCDTSGLRGLPGVCSLHHAEVLTSRGDFSEAEHELDGASENLPKTAVWALGDAYRLKGEIQLARCDYEEAGVLFQKSLELGWDPQPGYAMLQVTRGRPDLAIRGLERSLADMGWANRLRRGLLLSHLVTIAAQSGDLERARSAAAELESNPELSRTRALTAMRDRALAEITLAEGRCEDAVMLLRQAARTFAEEEALVEAASARLRLAEVLLQDGDYEAAAADISAAEASFRRLGIPARIETCQQMARLASG
jgi:DNA-binding winged helix-turn-helix (wHTH) protein/predicted negative regulator of RcsB-dependent stress response